MKTIGKGSDGGNSVKPQREVLRAQSVKFAHQDRLAIAQIRRVFGGNVSEAVRFAISRTAAEAAKVELAQIDAAKKAMEEFAALNQ